MGESAYQDQGLGLVELRSFIFYLPQVILIFRLWNMGCEHSQVTAEANSQSELLKRNNKKFGKIIGRASNNASVLENVKRVQEKISSKSEEKIKKIIREHFFFSNFSEDVRKDLVGLMAPYTCPKGEYVFKQKDPGNLFFIIKKGKVRIEINDKWVKTLEKGEYFGELSLLYTAPRSASVFTETDCTFWCLHQNAFKLFTEDLVKKNYKIAKPLLQKISLFQFLAKNQVNSIAYAMNSLKYPPDQPIFKEGDDANAFYIIVQGEVKITIKGKEPIGLFKGESFGQNSLQKSQVRSGSASAGPTGCILLSIGRQGLQKCLGDHIDDLIEYNILKWALKRSKIFANIPEELIRKFIQLSEIRDCNNNQIICKRGEIVKHFIVSLEGEVDDHKVGVLVNQEYLLEESGSKQVLYRSNIKKKGRGNVFMLHISKIEALLKVNLQNSLWKQENIFKNVSSSAPIVRVMEKEGVRQRTNVPITDLIYERKLGEGQFGKVFLVRDKNTEERYALKCIKKKDVIELGMEEFVITEKEVMEELDHPLIVKFEKSYKDQAFLYILMQYIDGIDFFDMLREIGICNSGVSRFYLACLILGIEELHSKNIVYRDLKPENAVVDSKGFLFMTDMGTAKRLTQDKGNRTFTIIGTPHYMAPEIMQGKGYGLDADIWSLGIILYEMVCGKLPYGDDLQDPYYIYKEIVSNKIQYPKFYSNKNGKSLIQKLLQVNATKRSIEDFNELKRDPYFDQFNWQDLVKKTIKPPVMPRKKNRKTEREKEEEMPLVKYLSKEVKSLAVSKPTDWDRSF